MSLEEISPKPLCHRNQVAVKKHQYSDHWHPSWMNAGEEKPSLTTSDPSLLCQIFTMQTRDFTNLWALAKAFMSLKKSNFYSSKQVLLSSQDVKEESRTMGTLNIGQNSY